MVKSEVFVLPGSRGSSPGSTRTSIARNHQEQYQDRPRFQLGSRLHSQSQHCQRIAEKLGRLEVIVQRTVQQPCSDQGRHRGDTGTRLTQRQDLLQQALQAMIFAGHDGVARRGHRKDCPRVHVLQPGVRQAPAGAKRRISRRGRRERPDKPALSRPFIRIPAKQRPPRVTDVTWRKGQRTRRVQPVSSA